jgi:hypothetical protein
MKFYERILYPTPLDFPTFEFRLLTLLPLEPGEAEAADKAVRCTLRYDFFIERYDEETGNTIPIPEYVARPIAGVIHSLHAQSLSTARLFKSRRIWKLLYVRSEL